MKKLLLAIMATGVLSGCTANETTTEEPKNMAKAEAAATSTAQNNDDFYVVIEDGRLNVFYEAELYKSFLSVGEATFRKTMIGAGPKGETVMHGLTKKDSEKASGIPSVEMLEGRLAPAEKFYGEIRHEGRINVFDNWALLQEYLANHEVAFRVTEVGAGLKGETIVFAQTKANSEKQPTELRAKFKAFYAK
ncbi:hypothetical protein [Thiomicrorhabdus aquaedulcis]|uniref:hypothetical protein n=1 Tax=Thiomicrorhabdus aquaedulcis TaxID=2211106 RepID=UPI000FDBA956|nr:hypothetical protein [Thiomicrorhabdus aquaedulcis]